MKIAVGKTSEQKIGYVIEVLDEIGIKAEIIPTEVKSDVSDQPITEEETQTGSLNRARATFTKNKDVDFAHGIEVGYHKNSQGNYGMFCCATIFDKADFITSCFSSKSFRNKSMAIVTYKDEFLIAQLKDYAPDDWNFPGGGIEAGETPEQAVLRELREELGSEIFKIIDKSKIIYEHSWPEFTIAKRLVRTGFTFRGQSITTFLVEFTGQKDEIKPDLGEIRKIKWVKYNNLKDHLLFPNQWENIEKILQELKYK